MFIMSKKPPQIAKWYEKEHEQLLNGASRLILLAIIDKSQKNGIHGYTIAEELEAQTRGEISKSTASFYAILRRLSDENLVEKQEGDSLRGGPRQYYRLTDLGRQVMKALYQDWQYYYQIISSFKNLEGDQY